MANPFLAIIIVALSGILAFAGIKLVGFLRRGEGTFRGSFVSRLTAPRLYWFIVATLTFVMAVAGYVIGVLGVILCQGVRG